MFVVLDDGTASGNHCICLSKAGRVFTFGDGSEGALGISIATGSSKCTGLQDLYSNKPRLVSDLDFVAVAASDALNKNYAESTLVYENGSANVVSAAKLLAQTPKITSVYTSAFSSAAISSSGHLYVWGSNDFGQLAIPKPRNIPHEITTDTSMPNNATNNMYEEMASSHNNHPSLTRPAHMQTFDSNHNVLLPIRVKSVDKYFIRSLALGPNHVFCFGTKRSIEEVSLPIGRTLHESQHNQFHAYQQQLDNAQMLEIPSNSTAVADSSKPIATGWKRVSTTEKKEFQPQINAPHESNSKKIDGSSNMKNPILISEESTVVSSSSSSPIGNINNVPQQQPEQVEAVKHNNGSTAIAVTDPTTATASTNASNTVPQIQRVNKPKEKRDGVIRRRFSFGLFRRRTSSEGTLASASRRQNKDVTSKNADDHVPSTGST
jgi:hypothetical protein